MKLTTSVKLLANKLLAPLNLKLDSLTEEKNEVDRIQRLIARGRGEGPVYALTPGMETFDHRPIAQAYATYAADIARLQTPGNPVGYEHTNNFFRSPDMEILYTLVRTLAPRRIIEIGCGSSTRISRQAISDGGLETTITAIDPWPRNVIAPFVDTFIQERLEDVDEDVFAALEPGDILFIDSSHEVRLGNDVAILFCAILPTLKPGVIVHVHDIFLPFEYRYTHLRYMHGWGEQYILHAVMQNRPVELLWPGFYVQQTRPEAVEAMPFLKAGYAQSFWIRLG